MSDKQKDSSSSTKDVQLNSNPNEVRSFEELEHCLEEYGRCEDCQQPNTGTNWCKSCNAERFKSKFGSWTSGNKEIDKFIQEIQLKANDMYELIEWVDYDKFENIEYLAKGGFSTVFKATWADGYIKWWSSTDQEWRRSGVDSWGNNGFVCLKSFNDSANMTSEFFEEGLRPKIKNRVPQLLLDLVNSCLDAEPNNRVSSKELTDILTQYYKDVHAKNKEAKIYQQIEAIEASTESSGYKPNKSTKLKSKQLGLVLPDFDDYTFEDEDN
nr:10998_t:CDS:2 [Entrophospora candida]